MSDKTERLDVLLAERELVASRSKGKRYIMAGQVYVDGQKVDKAGTQVSVDADIEIRGDKNPYVSRGGLKLEGAIDAFGYDCTDKVIIDVGASTGGFTDCVLQHGAERVYAVDVGYGQLAWKLRNDERVVVLERENIRHLERDKIPEPCDLAVVDCSFISLQLVLPNTVPFLADEADVIALIKPQFEVGKDNVGKGGVVRDQEIRRAAIGEVIRFAKSLDLELVDSVDSDVHGPAGNVEHLVWLRRTKTDST
jgi:23S rRNA (cytidine1920-2'-O)/16S rRNA (cytidine1409-2'-O)-methyltransferase